MSDMIYIVGLVYADWSAVGCHVFVYGHRRRLYAITFKTLITNDRYHISSIIIEDNNVT